MSVTVHHSLNGFARSWVASSSPPLAAAILAVLVATGLPPAGWFASSARAEEPCVKPGINQAFKKPDIAQFVERFEREGREIYDQREAIVAACRVRPGMVVADVGAGTGLFTRLLAQALKETGWVYAVDISGEFIESIAETAAKEELDNITAVVCRPDDVGLPPQSIDLALICDTYHHFEFPQKTMRSIHRALRPGGTVVVVDFRRIEGVSSEWVLGHVRAGQEVFTEEILAAGFRLIDEEKELFKESYLLRFEKVPLPSNGEAKPAVLPRQGSRSWQQQLRQLFPPLPAPARLAQQQLELGRLLFFVEPLRVESYSDIDALVAFLRALSGELPEVMRPELP